MANASLEGLRRRWQRFSQPATAQLRIHLPGQPTRLLALHAGAYRIGRDSDCQICVEHQAVSRHTPCWRGAGPTGC